MKTMNKRMRVIGAAALTALLTTASASAAMITWEPSVNLFAGGDNDAFISNNGTFVLAFNGGTTAVTTDLNGVTFTNVNAASISNGITGVGGVGLSFGGGTISDAGPTTFADGEFTVANVSAVINSAVFSGTNVTMTGLTISQKYEMQILVNDARGGTGQGTRDTAWEVGFTDGVGNATFTGIADLCNRALDDYGDPNLCGDYIIGTFTADATTQSFSMGATRAGFNLGQAYTNINGGQSQINGFQLRAISATPPPELTWRGQADGNWDATTTNWVDTATGLNNEVFTNTAIVTFDDIATNFTVNISGTVEPGSITVTNTAQDYTYSGTGKISGTTGLTKDGAGTLTLGNSGGNDFSGVVQLDDGTLTLADASALGDTGSALNAHGGTLDIGGFSVSKGAVNIANSTINNGTLTGTSFTAGAATVNAVLAGGSAALTKSGSGTLILANANTYDGSTTLDGGTVQLGSATALGSTNGTTALNSGATLDLNGQTIDEIFTAINGTFVNSDTGNTAEITAETVNLGNPTFDGPGDIIMDNIRHTAGVTRRTTKNGAGTLTLGGDQSNGRYGLTVNEGNVILAKTGGESVARFALIMNNASSLVQLQNKGDQISDSGDQPHQINAGTLDLNGFDEGLPGITLSVSPPVTNGIVTNGNGSTESQLTLFPASDLVWPGTIAGNIRLYKSAGFTQTLSGANTYTGDTTISAGTLALSGSGSLASPSITVAPNATFDVSAVTGGSYSLNGSGTLTMQINKSGATLTQGKVVATSLTLGGTLTVNLLGGALQNGNSFDLFDGTLAGSFAAINLPGNPAQWDTSQLTAGGDGTLTLIGNAPVAADFGLGVAVGESVVATVVGKFATDVDVGDTLTITLVSTPTIGTAGIVGGTKIIYTSTGGAGSDSFTYTVSDGLTTDTGTVTVSVSAAEGFNKLSGPTGSGPYSFSYLGIPGENYALEEAAQLTPPYTWEAVVTNTATGTGALEYNGVTLSHPSGSFRTKHVP